MRARLIYWIPTALVAALMGSSGVAYLAGAPQVVEGLRHLGYPDYFRVVLGAAKVLGALALIAPLVPRQLRDWAYAGFSLNLLAAVISHASVGDPAGALVFPAIVFGLVTLSYWAWRRRTSLEPAPVVVG
jgi:hypothetical protein